MTTNVFVNTYTYSVNYVSDKMLRSVHQIIQASGLDTSLMVSQWEIIDRGLVSWMESRHLEAVHLEVYDPQTDALVTRWDLNVLYSSNGNDGGFYEDPDAIRTAIVKAGHLPARCKYRIIATTADGRPDVQGWSRTTARSIDGMIRQSVGTALSAPDIQATATYWRKA